MIGDASALILIVKNERAEENWVYLDSGLQCQNMVLAAESVGISFRYLGVTVMNEKIRWSIEKLCNWKENSLIISIAFGKKHEEYKLLKSYKKVK